MQAHTRFGRTRARRSAHLAAATVVLAATAVGVTTARSVGPAGAAAAPGEVSLESIRPDGSVPPFSFFDDVSGDGSTVLFTGNADAFYGVFARRDGVTVRVDDPGNRTAGDRAALSDDGRWAAWASNSFSVGAPTRIVLHDLDTLARRELASFAGGSCGRVEVANDGAAVAFDTNAPLTVDDTNSTCDVYVWSADTNTVTLLSRPVDPPVAGTTGARLQAMTSTGSYALYTTDAEATRSWVGAAGDLVLVDLRTGARTVEGLDVDGDPLAAGVMEADLTDDASKIVFSSYSDATKAFGFDFPRTFLRTRTAPASTTAITGASPIVFATSPTIDADGSHIAARVEWSRLQQLPQNDVAYSVAVLDVSAGTWQLASRTSAGGPAGGDAQRPAISADGSTVGFTSFATDIVGAPAGAVGNPSVYTYGVTGLTPPDLDADGIADVVDADAGDGSLPGQFRDAKNSPVTFGRITSRPSGMAVEIADTADPDGVTLSTSGGSGLLKWQMCGIPMTLSMSTGSSAVLTCGSAITEVVVGEVVGDLGNGTTLTMPAGTRTRVAAVAGSTALTVEVQENTSGAPVVLSKDGITTQVGSTPLVVQAWRFTGFAQPIDNGGVINVAKAGSVVPVRWRLTRDGAAVTDLSSARVTFVTKACPGISTPVDEIEVTVASTSTLLDLRNGNYQVNWRVPSTGGCGEMRLDVGDGVTYTAQFRVR